MVHVREYTVSTAPADAVRGLLELPTILRRTLVKLVLGCVLRGRVTLRLLCQLPVAFGHLGLEPGTFRDVIA